MNLILFSGEKKSGKAPNQFNLLEWATPISGIRSSNEHNWVGAIWTFYPKRETNPVSKALCQMSAFFNTGLWTNPEGERYF